MAYGSKRKAAKRKADKIIKGARATIRKAAASGNPRGARKETAAAKRRSKARRR